MRVEVEIEPVDLLIQIEKRNPELIDRMIERRAHDESGLIDFLQACLSGDRHLAVALIPRAFRTRATIAAAEAVLLPVRRAA